MKETHLLVLVILLVLIVVVIVDLSRGKSRKEAKLSRFNTGTTQADKYRSFLYASMQNYPEMETFTKRFRLEFEDKRIVFGVKNYSSVRSTRSPQDYDIDYFAEKYEEVFRDTYDWSKLYDENLKRLDSVSVDMNPKTLSNNSTQKLNLYYARPREEIDGYYVLDEYTFRHDGTLTLRGTTYMTFDWKKRIQSRNDRYNDSAWFECGRH
jgi:hypothetical protein